MGMMRKHSIYVHSAVETKSVSSDEIQFQVKSSVPCPHYQALSTQQLQKVHACKYCIKCSSDKEIKKISKTKKNKASIRHLREIKSTRNVRYATRNKQHSLKHLRVKMCELSYHERILSSLYTEKKSMLWKCNNVLRI